MVYKREVAGCCEYGNEPSGSIHFGEFLNYVVGSKSFRPDIQKPRQMGNAVRDI